MITVTVKEYDGWLDVLETADLYGIIDLDLTMNEITDSGRADASYEFEDECLMALAERGVVFEL